ncbi:hypothetical protein DVR12_09455 [Chitinophaga silvatica]|uniref:Uncharacterized protein n=1 Tax=Chitinophaga silvatica TaxID=2282649 RepID=A0A3E1YB11_9BACT|nr:hypothetical protein [Chitinophaga silvatica]RFS23236.1 hypothetical protein DVR12_09455 [Chitinophaga silvatica]
MRSFVALMTCIGCIALIHSFDKRIVGVTTEKENSIQTIQQLPVAVFPVTIPAQYIKTAEKALVAPVVYAKKINIGTRKRSTKTKNDSLKNNLALIRQNSIFHDIENGAALDNNNP